MSHQYNLECISGFIIRWYDHLKCMLSWYPLTPEITSTQIIMYFIDRGEKSNLWQIQSGQREILKPNPAACQTDSRGKQRCYYPRRKLKSCTYSILNLCEPLILFAWQSIAWNFQVMKLILGVVLSLITWINENTTQNCKSNNWISCHYFSVKVICMLWFILNLHVILARCFKENQHIWEEDRTRKWAKTQGKNILDYFYYSEPTVFHSQSTHYELPLKHQNLIGIVVMIYFIWPTESVLVRHLSPHYLWKSLINFLIQQSTGSDRRFGEASLRAERIAGESTEK